MRNGARVAGGSLALAVASGAIASERGVRRSLGDREVGSRFGTVRWLVGLVAVLAAALCCGCATQSSRSAEAAYMVDAQGATTPIARSALAGSTAPGRQEIVGLYVPLGPNLAIKAGLEWDGTPTVIQVPLASPGAQYVPQYAPQSVAPQTVVVPRTVLQPETRLVPRVVYERQTLVPVPQAATSCEPAPAAQAAPLPSCGPPTPQATGTCPSSGR